MIARKNHGIETINMQFEIKLSLNFVFNPHYNKKMVTRECSPLSSYPFDYHKSNSRKLLCYLLLINSFYMHYHKFLQDIRRYSSFDIIYEENQNSNLSFSRLSIKIKINGCLLVLQVINFIILKQEVYNCLYSHKNYSKLLL